MVRNSEYFDRSTWSIRCPYCQELIGYDGRFEWDWIFECFPRGIMPMDFDAVVEINGHFLIIETKMPDAKVPVGQFRCLSQLHKAKSFVVVILWGKDKPEYFEYIRRNGEYKSPPQKIVHDEHVAFIRRWANAAERGLLDLRQAYAFSGHLDTRSAR